MCARPCSERLDTGSARKTFPREELTSFTGSPGSTLISVAAAIAPPKLRSITILSALHE
jgi:hypothetical protein